MPKLTHRDLGEQRFGRWLVYKESVASVQTHRRPSGKVIRKWLCRCDCGSESYVDEGTLTAGRSLSCGCLQKESAKGRIKKDSGLNRLISQYKRGAYNRGFSFDITKEEFRGLIAQPCYYCGAAPSKAIKSTAEETRIWYNGLDRVDNLKGYTTDNVVPCCSICNHAKHTLTQEGFLSWVKRVYTHIKEK